MQFTYSTDIDGGNDLTHFSITFTALDESAAWKIGNKAMDQLGIKLIDRVNPKVKRAK